jgi:acetoin utilization deacetylase AcuC-like enzyme
MTTANELVLFYPNGHEAHAYPGHQERPERVETIRAALQNAGWWEPFARLEPVIIPEQIIIKIHDPSWMLQLETICREVDYLDINTYVTPASYDLALRAAGGTAAVASAVWRRKAKRGFSLARPPGHHATRQRGGGFCLLNNIALAAEVLLQQEGAQRLAIVDLDLHHGNGTQDIFWQRNDVLYISTHQMPLFPGTGWLEETGGGVGKGATANFPLPPGAGDKAFRTVLEELILPLLDRFAPEMLLISFGFDTHWRDPIGSLLLSAMEYGHLIASLANWADEHCEGRIILVLEGGYDLAAASACATAVTAALLGLTWSDPIGRAPYDENLGWQQMVAQAKRLWGIR